MVDYWYCLIRIRQYRTYWLCRCDCGKEKIIVGKRLRRSTRSCGCLCVDTLREKATTHGKRRTPEYGIWCGMINRCYNKNVKSYIRYGGRGITVCERWRNSFQEFFNDMGERPFKGASLERIKNNLPYCKSNCRWATMKEQCANRRSSVYYTHNGETKILQYWAEKLNADHSHITYHIKRGRSFHWVYDYFMNKKKAKNVK